MKIINLELKPVTPIHVWSGIDLVKDIDFVDLGDKVCIIDLDKLLQFIRIEDLVKLTKEKISHVIRKYAQQLRLCKEILDKRSTETANALSQFNPYGVPGSSIKGYLRTALLNYFIENAEKLNVKLKVDGVISALKDELQRNIVMLQTFGNKKRIRHPKYIGASIEGIVRTPRPAKQGAFYDLFQTLVVSDPIKILIHRSVRMLYIKELKSELRDISSKLIECLDPGSMLKYHIQLITPPELSTISSITPEHNMIADLHAIFSDVKILFEALRSFSQKLIKFEINRVEQFEKLQSYVKVLEDLLRPPRECIAIRIGLGAGHKVKTVLLTLKQSGYEDIVTTVQQYMTLYYKRFWDDLTVKLVDMNGKLVGMGWALLCRTKE